MSRGELIISGGRAAVNSPIGRASLQKLKDLLISLGLWEGIQAAADYAPDVLERMWNNMSESGVEPDKLKASRDGGRKVALVEAARLGLVLDKSAGLTEREARASAKMLQDFGSAVSASNDANQASKPQDNDVQKAAYMLAMSRVCNRLGLNGANRFRRLYEIAQVINTITEKDVENAELHETYFGTIQ